LGNLSSRLITIAPKKGSSMAARIRCPVSIK
jgi:hypothetical protein